MKTILVDDEILAMQFFSMECANIDEVEIIATFEDSRSSLEFASNHFVELAVLDIELPEMNGIELGQKLKEINPNIILIFISAHDEYAMQAYRLHAPVFLEKPYNREDVLYAIDTAKLFQSSSSKSIAIRTFGFFDIYVNEKLVHFSNKKSKELLAYLVDRKGHSVSNEQAICILWEDAVNDARYQSKLRRAVKDLRDTLRAVNAEHILINYPNSRAVDTSAFDCDYYRFLSDKNTDHRFFPGAYMSEYSWAEETLGFLYSLSERE